MVNREMKQAIGDELQTLFHPIVNATKQAAEATRKELSSMKKALMDIDGPLVDQRATEASSKSQLNKNADATFGLYMKQDGQLDMGNKIVWVDVSRKTLTVDDKEYRFTPGLVALITQKHPQPAQYNSNDYQVYKSLVVQTKVRSISNGSTGAARPHTTCKWKHILRRMAIPKRKEEGSEDTDHILTLLR